MLIFFLFLDENICCGYSLEAPQLDENICCGYSLETPHENICCGYSLEAPHWGTSNEYPQHMWGASNEYPQHMFSSRNKKNIMWIPPLICSYELYCACSWLETDNCPSWISGGERITWSNLHERMLLNRPGLIPQPPVHQYQLDAHPTELLRPAGLSCTLNPCPAE